MRHDPTPASNPAAAPRGLGLVRGALALVLVVGALFVALGLAAPRALSMTSGVLALGLAGLGLTLVAVPWLLGFASARWQRLAPLVGVLAVALLATTWLLVPNALT